MGNENESVLNIAWILSMDEVQRLSNQSSNTLSHRHLNLEKKKKKIWLATSCCFSHPKVGRSCLMSKFSQGKVSL